MNEQMNVKLTLHLPYVLVLELTELIVTRYSNFIITIYITFVFWMYILKLVSRLHYFNTCFQKSLGIPNKCSVIVNPRSNAASTICLLLISSTLGPILEKMLKIYSLTSQDNS